jgi:hypothetical protein
LDEEMLVVAEKWFGFHRGERLTVHIADGVRFISECVSAKKHGKSHCWKLSYTYTTATLDGISLARDNYLLHVYM